MKTLILLEHEHQRIANTTYPVFTAAQSFSSSYDVLVVGHQVAAVAKQAARCAGVDTVLVADHPAYEHGLAENTAQLIAAIAPGYEVILASATSLTKDILPRVAALLDVSMHSEVIKIIATDTFVRPIYAGNAFATVQALDSIKLLSIRASAFAPMNVLGETATLKNLSQVEQPTLSTFMSRQLTPLTRPALTSARIVISGGRGLKSAENFKLIEQIADCLGAAVGASRAAVDAGFAPNDYQVGQTGKVVAPDLYIAVGISGAVQHLAGMKDSKVIVAINNDPDAPIFELADYSLVGDLFVILPELHQALSSECAQI